jgi:O-antigen/teichoic acid export membrane protein
MQKESVQNSDSLEVTKGAGITLLATLIGKFMLFSYTIFLARFVEHSALGLYFLGLAVIQGVTIFSCFGLNIGATRYLAISQNRNDIQSMKGIVISAIQFGLTISIAVSFLVYCFANLVAIHIFSKPLLGQIFVLFSIGISFEVLLKIFLAALIGIKNIRDSVLIENIIWFGLRLLCGVIFVLTFDDKLKAIVLAYCVSSFLTAIIAGIYVSKNFPFFNRSIAANYHRSELLHFSFPMVFAALINNLTGNIDIFMLGIFVSTADIGVYSIAVRITTFAGIFFSSFLPIFQPFTASLHDTQEINRLADLLKSCTKWSFSIGSPILLSLCIVPEFFLYLFGQTFLQGGNCLKILTIAIASNYITLLTASVIVMSGKSKITLYNNVFTIAINSLLNLYFINKFGILGAAISTGATFIMLAAIRIVEVYKLFNIHAFQKEFWKPIASSAISIVFISLFNIFCNGQSFFSLSVRVILIFSAFFGSMMLFGLNEQDRYLLGKIAVKFRKVLTVSR